MSNSTFAGGPQRADLKPTLDYTTNKTISRQLHKRLSTFNAEPLN